MVTTLNRETEPSAVVAAPVVEPAAAAPALAPVDISAVPETTAELLKQWDVPKRSLIGAIPAAVTGLWDAITGPGMTAQDRIRRDIAEHNGYIRAHV